MSGKGLRQLPVELLLDVARELSRFDLDSLARTSKYLRGHILPLLSRDAYLLSVDGLLVYEKAGVLDRDERLLEHATSVTVVSPAPARTLLAARVPGECRSCDPRGTDGGAEGVHVVERLGDYVPGKLKKFHWLLGTCIPNTILAHLSHTQASLSELKLVTNYDGTGRLCCTTRTLDLSPFTHLTSLSWTGIDPTQHPTLSSALLQTCAKLTHLELDFLTNPTRGRSQPGPPHYGANGFLLTFVLSHIPKSGARLFPRLTSLSLANVLLHDPRQNSEPDVRFPHALNVRRLERLRLCWCHAWEILLTSREPGEPSPETSPTSDSSEDDDLPTAELPLRSLELQTYIPVSYLAKSQVRTLTSTLKRTPLLESLVVYIRARGLPAHAIGRMFVKLFGDLRRLEGLPLRELLFHMDLPDPRRIAERAEWGGLVTCPLMDLVFGQPRQHIEGELPGFISYGNLPSNFVRDEPAMRHAWLRTNAYNRSGAGLQGLHVRQTFLAHRHFFNRATGYTLPDHEHVPSEPISMKRVLTRSCYEYVTELFTCGRFPHLRFIAFGDFSTFEPRARILLCRSDVKIERGGRSLVEVVDSEEEPMRLVNEDDGDVIELLDRYMHLLLAGPEGRWWTSRVGTPSHGSSSWVPGLGMKFARENGRKGASVVDRERTVGELGEFPDYALSDWDPDD